jgi:hypothetical protein
MHSQAGGQLPRLGTAACAQVDKLVAFAPLGRAFLMVQDRKGVHGDIKPPQVTPLTAHDSMHIHLPPYSIL